MAGLPPGQFADYLLIGLIGAVLAGIAVELLKNGKLSTGRTLIAIALVVACVIVRFKYNDLIMKVPDNGTRLSPSPIPSVESTRVDSGPKAIPKASPQNSLIQEYISSPNKSLRKTGQWSVLIADPEGHESYSKLANTVAAVLSEKGRATAAIFRPPLTRGAGFESLFAADPALTRRLNEYCDQIFLGRVTSSQKDNPVAAGLMSLTLTLNGKIIATRSGDVQDQFELSAVGAGYSTGEAKSNAEDTLAANLRSELLKALK